MEKLFLRDGKVFTVTNTPSQRPAGPPTILERLRTLVGW